MKDVETLLQALPYIRRLKNATLVLKCGGEIARDPGALASLAEDVALCSHVGIRTVARRRRSCRGSLASSPTSSRDAA